MTLAEFTEELKTVNALLDDACQHAGDPERHARVIICLQEAVSTLDECLKAEVTAAYSFGENPWPEEDE